MTSIDRGVRSLCEINTYIGCQCQRSNSPKHSSVPNSDNPIHFFNKNNLPQILVLWPPSSASSQTVYESFHSWRPSSPNPTMVGTLLSASPPLWTGAQTNSRMAAVGSTPSDCTTRTKRTLAILASIRSVMANFMISRSIRRIASRRYMLRSLLRTMLSAFRMLL